MKIIWKQSYTGMPYNSFEHKIKDKLHDATMQPDAEVWDKISSRLQAEGNEEIKSAFVLPLFLRKENLKYTLSSAAAITLMAVALNTGAPTLDDTGSNTLADVNTIEVEQNPCMESLAQSEEVGMYPIKPITSSTHISIKKIEEDARVSLLIGHEIVSEPIATSGLRQSTSSRVNLLKPLTPLSIGISGFDTEPIIASVSSPGIDNRIVPISKRKKVASFKPRLTWGLTAMSALHLNSLSESIQANEFEDNLVGISSLSSQFQYPNGVASARAEIELLLSEKVGITTGVGFTNSYQNTRFDNNRLDVAEPTFTSNANEPPGLGFAALNANSGINDLSYSSLDIPLFLNYYLKKGKSKFLLSTGLLYKHILTKEPDVLFETVAYTTNAQTSIRYVEAASGDLSIQDLVFLIGRAHYQLKLGRSIALTAGPTLNLGLGPAFSYQQSSSRNPLSMGFEVGFIFFPGG